MIEERIGHWLAIILVWVISITFLIGGLYYTISFTQGQVSKWWRSRP